MFTELSPAPLEHRARKCFCCGGATICKDLKGRDTGRVLCECPECCRNAVLAAEEVFA